MARRKIRCSRRLGKAGVSVYLLLRIKWPRIASLVAGSLVGDLKEVTQRVT